MTLRRGRPYAIVFACFVTLAAGCSSSDSGSSANYVSVSEDEPASTENVDPASTNGTETASSASSASSASMWSGAAPVDEITSVVQVFDQFLAIRARAITGDAELSELAGIATPAAIEQVAQRRNENDTKVENDAYSALSDLAEWSNITTVDQVENRYRFRDCTESQFLTPGGFTVVNFVTNDVSLIEVDGGLKVDNIEVVQDGVASTSDELLGCVPPSFAERAALTAELAVDEAELLIEDPRAALAAGLSPVFVDQARADLEQGLQSLSNDGLSRVADEQVGFTVLGMDVNRPDFTVVVSVCRTYPTGRTYTDRSGEQTTTDLPTGSSYEEWVYVQLQADAAGDSADVVTEVHDRGPNCERS